MTHQHYAADPFAGLPFDTLSRILRHVDCLTMRNVLLVSHTVRNYSIVLLENNMKDVVKDLFMFVLPDIQYVALSSLDQVYQQRPQSFKLIEYVSGSSSPNWLTPEVSQSISKDHNTFMHFRDDIDNISTGFPSFVRSKRLLLDWYSHGILDNRGPSNPFEVTSFTKTWGVPDPFSHFPNVQSLNISINTDFVDFEFPRLTAMAIHFCRPVSKPHARLRMAGINAPSVRKFDLRYSGSLPELWGNNIGASGFFARRGRMLKITNTQSLSLRETEYDTDFHTLSHNYTSEEFGKLFLNFESVVLRGAPPFLLSYIPESAEIDRLLWINNVQHAESTNDEQLACRLRALDKFTVINTVPEMSLPRFIHPVSVQDLKIHAVAPGFKLNGLFESISFDEKGVAGTIHEMSPVSVDIRAKLDPGFFGIQQKYITLTRSEWSKLLSFPDLNKLTLEGCYFGDANNSLLSESECKFSVTQHRMQTLKLGLLPAPAGTKRPEALHIGLFNTWDFEQPFQLSIYELEAPASEPSQWVYYRSIVVKLNTESFESTKGSQQKTQPSFNQRKLRFV